MIKLLNGFNRGGEIIPAGKTLALPAELEAKLIESGGAEAVVIEDVIPGDTQDEEPKTDTTPEEELPVGNGDIDGGEVEPPTEEAPEEIKEPAAQRRRN